MIPRKWHENIKHLPLKQLVCEKNDLYASACGVARAYPTYSRKTASGASSSEHTVTVEVILVGKGDTPLTQEDIKVSIKTVCVYIDICR